jgi:hypothetical protein
MNFFPVTLKISVIASVAISYKECHYEERSNVVISYEKFISFYEITSLRS